MRRRWPAPAPAWRTSSLTTGAAKLLPTVIMRTCASLRSWTTSARPLTSSSGCWEGTSIIYHDALSAWFEPAAQAHMASLGYGPERQMLCRGLTNWGTRYWMKLVGNRPEFMPLDTNIFAHLKNLVRKHCAMAPEKFNAGTTKQLWSAFARCWSMLDANLVKHDIERFPVHVDRWLRPGHRRAPWQARVVHHQVPFRLRRRYLQARADARSAGGRGRSGAARRGAVEAAPSDVEAARRRH